MPYHEILSPRFLRTDLASWSVLQNLGLSISLHGPCIRLINSKKCSINGHFLRVLQSVYKNDKACIKPGNKMTETFSINIGVKQGDNPSPVLFNLHLHVLLELSRHETTDPVLIKDNLPIGESTM